MQTVDPIFERFLQPESCAAATVELADRGELAVPVLEALFNGTAKNRYGIPYRQLGVPLDCALVAAGRLGSLARPLEPFLRAELRGSHPYAAQALGSLGALEEDTVVALAEALCGDILIAAEAAAALVRSKASDSPVVKLAVDNSAIAARALGAAVRA